MPFDFDFLKLPVYPYGLKKIWFCSLNWILLERLFFLVEIRSNILALISLEYDAGFDESYATTVSCMLEQYQSHIQGNNDSSPDTI